MNIVFLSRSYYPNVGGVEKHVYEISKRLIVLGHHVTIVTEDTRREKGVDFNFSLKNVDVIEIPVGGDDWFKKIRIWRWMWQHKNTFLKADVIHCHDVFFWYLPLALTYPLKDVYTTFHGYESYPIKKKAIIYRKIFEYMCNRTICVGEFMTKWYHARPTKVIYGAAEITSKKIKPKKNTAIFIGRLDEHTGIGMYAEAIKLIRKKIPSFTLTVYGDGPYAEQLKDQEGIIFKGYDLSAEKEIIKYEYAFVSRYLSILEAMAAKRQVVAVYDNPVKKDYLMMTPFKDWIDICHNDVDVAKIVTEKTGNESVTKAFSWVSEQTWDRLAEVYLSLWQK